MAKDLMSELHIELYGLPGCGKSSTSIVLADLLRKQGYDVEEPSKAINEAKMKHIKKMEICLRYCLKDIYNIKEVCTLVHSNGYTGLAAVRQFINVTLKLYIYKNSCKKIYLWDEGMIQAGVSLGINSEKGARENIEYLDQIVGKPILRTKIYLYEDVDTVLHRIQSRQGGKSRVDKCHDSLKQKEMLRRFLLTCDSVEADIFVEGKKRSNDALAKVIFEELSKTILGDVE